MKKLLSLATAVILLVGVLAGCAPKDAGSGAAISFTYLRPVWGPATYSKGGEYEKLLFKEGNVKIDAQFIPVTEYDSKVNLIISSGNIPDLIWGQGPDNGFFADVIDQGAFLNIAPYLEKYPVVKNSIPADILAKLTNDKGEVYFLPNMLYSYVPFLMYYRKDWFDTLGISEPKTTDELTAALRKIKAAGINGDKNITPLSIGDMWYGKDFATSFGAVLNGWGQDKDDAGRIVPWFMTEGAKDHFFNLRDMYSEGLLDQDYLLGLDPTKALTKFKTGKAAVLIHHYTEFLKSINALKLSDPKAEVAIMSPLAGSGGIQGGSLIVGDIDRGIYVNAKAKDPDGIFKYLTWAYTDGYELVWYGVEGKTFNWNEDHTLRVEIPNEEREKDWKAEQGEPLQLTRAYSDKIPDWTKHEAEYKKAGLMDEYKYFRQKFDEYCAVPVLNLRNPFMRSEKYSNDYQKLYEDHLKPTVEGIVLNKDATRQDWDNQVKKWYDAGGKAIVDEVNKVQNGWKPELPSK